MKTAQTPTERAAGFVAKAMANTHPGQREALMVAMMRECASAITVISGREHAAEEVYRLGDHLAGTAQ